MKKIFSLVMMAMIATTSFAQSAAQLAKMQKETNKAYADLVNIKVSKSAKKQAKDLEKKGWQVPLGEPALDKQLTRVELMQEELMKDMNGDVVKRYMMQPGRQTSGSYNVAVAAARTAAMTEIASQLNTSIVAAYQQKFGNEQNSNGESTTYDKFNQSLKGVIDQNLKGVVPVMTAYRELDNGQFDVQVRYAFDKKSLIADIRKQLMKELEMEGDVLDSLVDDILCKKF